MGKKKRLSAVGGDERQLYIAKAFERTGFDVEVFGIEGARDSCGSLYEAVNNTDHLILPVPITRDGYRLNCSHDILLMDLIDMIPNGCFVLGGKIPPFFKDHLRAKEVLFSDYYEDKEYIWRNAEISAEGAIAMLCSETKTAIDELKILICGNGRIGKCLAKKLKALGADITVAARKKEALLEAEYCFDSKTDIIDYSRKGTFDLTETYDVIFNTVPSWIFDKDNASMLKSAIYFELASAPYGGELEFLRSHSKKFILASGIPGKYAPESAGTAAYKAICGCLCGEVIE